MPRKKNKPETKLQNKEKEKAKEAPFEVLRLKRESTRLERKVSDERENYVHLRQRHDDLKKDWNRLEDIIIEKDETLKSCHPYVTFVIIILGLCSIASAISWIFLLYKSVTTNSVAFLLAAGLCFCLQAGVTNWRDKIKELRWSLQ